MRASVMSYTIPCHKRLDDLVAVWPSVVEAAAVSPPVEIVLIDYANPEPLLATLSWPSTVSVRPVVYRGRDYYHMAHARNLSIKAAAGEYVVIGNADTHLRPYFFSELRWQIAHHRQSGWLQPESEFVGMVTVKRAALLAIGGFDERIEFYGSEDKDLRARLMRFGMEPTHITIGHMVSMIRTRNASKVANYRLRLTKTEMLQRGSAILRANNEAGTVIANAGMDWGALS